MVLDSFDTGVPFDLQAHMNYLACVDLDYQAQYSIEHYTLLFVRGTGNFSWCIMILDTLSVK